MTHRSSSIPVISAAITPYHWQVFWGCWLGGIFDGMDSTLMMVVMSPAIQDLTQKGQFAANHSTSEIASWITAIFLLGWTLGGVLMGLVGDKLGRVRSMVLSILLYAVFTGLAGFAQNWPQLAVCRFLTGLGIGGELVSIATFLTEVWPAASRPLIIGGLITSYQAGVFLAGLVSFQVPHWRQAFFVGALPALLVFFLRRTLKESEKWEAVQQTETHQQMALKDFFMALFASHYQKNLVCGCLVFAGLLVGYWASLSWIPTWIKSLPGVPENAHSVASMAQGLAAMVGCLASGWLCQLWGRRLTLGLFFVLGLLSSALLFLTHQQFSGVIYGQVALLAGCIGVLQAGLYIYLPELFPTLIRATAVGFCLNAGRLITAGSVLFMSLLLAVMGGHGTTAFIYSLSYGVGALALLLGPETKGRPLPD